MTRLLVASAFAVLYTPVAHAIQLCDLDGQPVNPANGATTAGKSGLMRCRDGEGGPVVREQELQRGVFMGVVRYYRGGVLEREYRVNERGNRDGRARDFAATPGATNPLLRDETYRDGTSVGIARSWHSGGALRRVSFHGDDGREQAVAEFNRDGQLSELRCGPRPQLAPDADDAKWCGHGGPTTVTLYAGSGAARGRLTHDRGERTGSETLWDNGKLREQQQLSAGGGFERSFSAEGVKRRETKWVDAGGDARQRRVTVLDQEFHESGTLVRERRWRPTERGGELESERRWYLNGQPREVQEYLAIDGQPARRDTGYHDNDRKTFEGAWLVGGRGDTRPLGVHKTYDAEGRLRGERHHDARERISREREFDEAGRATRDDEVFEDGSRKAYAR